MTENKHMDAGRRRFLKIFGVGAAGLMAGCGSDGKSNTSGHSNAGKGEMTCRVNHNSGDKVSLLGYGMMRLPMTTVEGQEQKVIDQDEVNALVDYAMEHGVNYYDTSPVYCRGKSEEATGIALSRHPRDKYFIATKLSNFSPESWPREKSIEMFESSLKYLQTDYIDYLLLHSIGSSMDDFNHRFIENGMLDYLKEQKERGRIRNLGFSFHGNPDVFDTMLKWMDEGKVHWDFVQIQLNYMDWNSDRSFENRGVNAEYLYHELAMRDIPVVIMEPLLGGRLANVPDPVVAKMKQRDPESSVASWAFRFAGTPDKILTVLSGMTYMDHLKDNLRTYMPHEPLSEDEQEFLRLCSAEIRANNQVPCTACQYCMPCPYGLDIPGIFAHYNKCINEDNAPRDTRDPHYAKARRAFLVGYDRAVPAERQASRCIGCNECVSHCPQEIDIPGQMAGIDAYVERLRSGKA